MREESGTPDVIGSVRIGLSLMIREKISDEFVVSKENEINEYVYRELMNIPNLFLLGEKTTTKIPIFSFVIKFSGRLLHFNFVSSLLNDLFGIQSRGGCSCASTYGQKCLGLDENYLEKLENIVCNGSEIFRPGYSRINFPFFYEKNLLDYMIYAIKYIAQYGYLFLSHYAFKIESGEYYHRNEEEEKRKWLNQINFIDGKIIIPELIKENEKTLCNNDLEEMKMNAQNILKDMRNITKHILGKSKINHKILFEEKDQHRWFLIPDDLESLNINNNFENIFDDESIDKIFHNKIKSEINKKLSIKFELENLLNLENSNEIKDSNQFTASNKNEEIHITDKQNTENNDNLEFNELSNIETNNEKISNKKLQDINLFPE